MEEAGNAKQTHVIHRGSGQPHMAGAPETPSLQIPHFDVVLSDVRDRLAGALVPIAECFTHSLSNTSKTLAISLSSHHLIA